MQLAFITLGKLHGFFGWWRIKYGRRNTEEKSHSGVQKVPSGAVRLKTSFPPLCVAVDLV